MKQVQHYIKDKFLKPYYYFLKDLFLKGNDHFLKKNNSLKNKFEGKRVFFLMSGESINTIDISRLKSEITYGYGYLNFHKEIVDLPLDFYQLLAFGAKQDKSYGWGYRNWPEHMLHSGYINMSYLIIRELVSKFLNNGTKLILNADRINYLKKINLFNINDNNVFYLKAIDGLDSRFSPKLDLTKRFIGRGGGFFDSILVMIFMGFKKIYLCGAGYTYDPPWMFHYYDNYFYPKDLGTQKAEQKLKKEIDQLNKRLKTSMKVFGMYEHGNFFRAIITKPMSEILLNDHRIINEFAKLNDVEIINILPTGFKSPIFKSVYFNELNI